MVVYFDFDPKAKTTHPLPIWSDKLAMDIRKMLLLTPVEVTKYTYHFRLSNRYGFDLSGFGVSP